MIRRVLRATRPRSQSIRIPGGTVFFKHFPETVSYASGSEASLEGGRERSGKKLKSGERRRFRKIFEAGLFVENGWDPMDTFKMLTQTEYLKKGAGMGFHGMLEQNYKDNNQVRCVDNLPGKIE